MLAAACRAREVSRSCHDCRVTPIDVEQWLRQQCQQYRYDPRGVFRTGGTDR
jgi:hypothetical protein